MTDDLQLDRGLPSPERRVLSSVLPNRRDRLALVSSAVHPDLFTDVSLRNLFVIINRYHGLTGGIPTAQTLEEVLSRQLEPIKVAELLNLFVLLRDSTPIEDHVLRHSIEELKEAFSTRRTGEVIADAAEILQRGKTVGKTELRGHESARQHVYSELTKIDKINYGDYAPEGDMRTERDDILQQYTARKSGELKAGILSGIDAIDINTLGFHPGDLVLAAAYTNQGKTTLASQAAWHTAVVQGKNFYFATSETVRDQVRRKILARHTRLPQFNRPSGINSRGLKHGSLKPDEEAVVLAALDDLSSNPTYGKMHIAQIPRGCTLGELEARLQRACQDWKIDFIIVDYLALLKPDRHRQSAREEYNDLIKEAKMLAVTVNDGQGAPILSPWQMSQAAYEKATRLGEYSLASLAETSEAEKTADAIISLLHLPDTKNELKLQHLKLRDDAIPNPVTIEVDYGTTYMNTRQDVTSASILGDELDDFD